MLKGTILQNDVMMRNDVQNYATPLKFCYLLHFKRRSATINAAE